eukprot:GAHX01000887.1.p1 GENE.GAHX01000887.1~~GAHX01000887.1.p1  ORF type:complete len:376 (-),score=79.30 GAHX01000887.1:42-1169(-)
MSDKAFEAKKDADDLYRISEYQKAFNLYKKALEHAHIPSVYTNAAACLIELENFPLALLFADQCLDKCEDINLSQRARAHERAATALHRYADKTERTQTDPVVQDLNRNQEMNASTESELKDILSQMSKEDLISLAMDRVKKGLIEHRTSSLTQLENDLKKAKKAALINKPLSEELRAKGNEFVAAKKYAEAVSAYTEAIMRNPEDYRIYSNRALCYTKLMSFSAAIEDCQKCIEIQPRGYVKAYMRLTKIYSYLKLLHRSIKALNDYLNSIEEYEFEGKAANISLVETEKARILGEAQMFNMKDENKDSEAKERMEKAKSDSEIEMVVKNMDVQIFLENMRNGKNMEGLQMLNKDKHLRQNIEYLTAAGVVRMG